MARKTKNKRIDFYLYTDAQIELWCHFQSMEGGGDLFARDIL